MSMLVVKKQLLYQFNNSGHYHQNAMNEAQQAEKAGEYPPVPAPNDYVIYKLTGEVAIYDSSARNISGIVYNK